MRRRIVVIASTVSVMLFAAVLLLSGSSAAENGADPSSSPPLLGKALAESLKLEFVKLPSTGSGVAVDVSWCKVGLAEVPEIPDGGAYCMDGALDPADPAFETKRFILAKELNGIVPSEQDIASYQWALSPTSDAPSLVPGNGG